MDAKYARKMTKTPNSRLIIATTEEEEEEELLRSDIDDDIVYINGLYTDWNLGLYETQCVGSLK